MTVNQFTSSDEQPAYRILDPAGFYGDDDTLYTLDAKGNPAEIYFDGEPNEQMEPLNEAARVKLNEYLDKLDNLAKVAAEKAGRPFVGRPRSLDGAIAIATQDMRNSMSIMGDKSKVSTITTVVKPETPETGSLNAKRPRGRPKKTDVVPLSSQTHIAA